MSRPRKFKTPKALADAWEAYKTRCNNMSVLTHEFSAKISQFVSKELKRSVTYTVEGFCVFAGLPRQDFYATYADDPRFCDTVTRIREECEIDAREKFELELIPSRLAGLWMSNYGYTTKVDNKVTVPAPVIIHDDLLED